MIPGDHVWAGPGCFFICKGRKEKVEKNDEYYDDLLNKSPRDMTDEEYRDYKKYQREHSI